MLIDPLITLRNPVMSVRDSGFMSVHDSGACRYLRAGVALLTA